MMLRVQIAEARKFSLQALKLAKADGFKINFLSIITKGSCPSRGQKSYGVGIRRASLK